MGSDESVCDPNAHRPGVLAFMEFVLKNMGGSNASFARPCIPGKNSGHHAARAWDWKINAFDSEEKARADELLDWLMANDAELFRRAGLAYAIWNKKVWSAYRPYWHPYDGFDEQGQCKSGSCRDPHTNHVHFSFNWPGADGKTSFYRWLRGNRPVKKPPEPVEPLPTETSAAKATTNILPFIAGSLVGFGLVFWGSKRWLK